MFDALKIKNDIVQWIKDWFDKNGRDCTAVIGISGGKDSSVVAALCVEALGKDRVLGILMPNGQQGDIYDSYQVVNHLDIKRIEIDIHRIYKDMEWEVLMKIGHTSEQTVINLPCRIRMTLLYAISQSVNGRVANTCNLSEDYVGYSTRWGDSVGDFSPLANLTTDEVMAIGEACGLPRDLVYKTPSDGLCGKTDEDNLGFTYKVLNKYIRTGVCEDAVIKNRIDTLHEKNLFKLQPIPAFPYKEE